MSIQATPYNWTEILYMRHGETLSAYLQNKVLPALNSGAGSLDSEKLLEEFVKRWSNHMLMNNWYRKFFRNLVSSFFLEKYKTSFDINLAFAGSLPREIPPLTYIGKGGIGAL